MKPSKPLHPDPAWRYVPSWMTDGNPSRLRNLFRRIMATGRPKYDTQWQTMRDKIELRKFNERNKR